MLVNLKVQNKSFKEVDIFQKGIQQDQIKDAFMSIMMKKSISIDRFKQLY